MARQVYDYSCSLTSLMRTADLNGDGTVVVRLKTNVEEYDTIMMNIYLSDGFTIEKKREKYDLSGRLSMMWPITVRPWRHGTEGRCALTFTDIAT